MRWLGEAHTINDYALSIRCSVALITFSDVRLTNIRFDYNDYTNKESLRGEAKAVLDSLTPSGTTHIGNAIKVLLEELNQNGRGYRGASGAIVSSRMAATTTTTVTTTAIVRTHHWVIRTSNNDRVRRFRISNS